MGVHWGSSAASGPFSCCCCRWLLQPAAAAAGGGGVPTVSPAEAGFMLPLLAGSRPASSCRRCPPLVSSLWTADSAALPPANRYVTHTHTQQALRKRFMPGFRTARPINPLSPCRHGLLLNNLGRWRRLQGHRHCIVWDTHQWDLLLLPLLPAQLPPGCLASAMVCCPAAGDCGGGGVWCVGAG